MNNVTRRKERGSMSVLLVLILLGVVMLGALSMDLAHGAMVRDQLQTATDAGALAGAQELTRNALTSSDTSTAQAYATNITASNLADSIPVSNSKSTNVSVEMVTTWMPRTITVTATRQVDCLFARLVGWNGFPVSATSTAAAYQKFQSVRPGQVSALAVSLDCVPSKGAQKGVPLNSIIGPGAENQIFTIVLAPTKEENGAWIKDWSDLNEDSVDIGVDQISLTNGVKASMVKALTPGETIILPIFKGDGPFNDKRTVVAIVGFTITSVSTQEITGHLTDKILLSGVRETSKKTLSGQDALFNDKWAPWQVNLIN